MIQAVDSNLVVDTDFSDSIILAISEGAGSTTMSAANDQDSNSATVTLAANNGELAISDLQITYTASGTSNE